MPAASMKLPVQMNASNLVIGVSVLLFVFTRLIGQTMIGDFVDSLVGRLLLVSFVLYGITLGPLPGVFSFLAVASLFAERNRSLIHKARYYIIGRGSPQTLGQVDMPHSKPAPLSADTAPRPWLQYESEGSILEGDGWNSLPAGESEDDKKVLESQLYPNDDQEMFYEKNGLAPPPDPNKNANTPYSNLNPN